MTRKTFLLLVLLVLTVFLAATLVTGKLYLVGSWQQPAETGIC